jgi:hypothetical protein
VAEGARLESVCRGNSTEGSNPSVSASPSLAQAKEGFILINKCDYSNTFSIAVLREPFIKIWLCPKFCILNHAAACNELSKKGKE